LLEEFNKLLNQYTESQEDEDNESNSENEAEEIPRGLFNEWLENKGF